MECHASSQDQSSVSLRPALPCSAGRSLLLPHLRTSLETFYILPSFPGYRAVHFYTTYKSLYDSLKQSNLYNMFVINGIEKKAGISKHSECTCSLVLPVLRLSMRHPNPSFTAWHQEYLLPIPSTFPPSKNFSFNS